MEKVACHFRDTEGVKRIKCPNPGLPSTIPGRTFCRKHQNMMLEFHWGIEHSKEKTEHATRQEASGKT